MLYFITGIQQFLTIYGNIYTPNLSLSKKETRKLIFSRGQNYLGSLEPEYKYTPNSGIHVKF